MKLRRRHYAEVHPTYVCFHYLVRLFKICRFQSTHCARSRFRFDMLENGEYPSFAEICHFETQGYNFAFYEQSIITPRMLGYTTDI